MDNQNVKNQKTMGLKISKTMLYSVGIFFTLAAFSCSKDEDPAPPAPETAPISSIFFVESPFNIVKSGSGSYEYGFAFKVAKNGSITKLGCKMPDSTSYRIALWDSASKKVLTEKTLTVNASELKLETITPIRLKADTTYLITIYSTKRWFEFRRPNNSKITYPLVKGNIRLQNYYWIGSSQGSGPKFPTNKDLFYTAGLPDLEFQAD